MQSVVILGAGHAGFQCAAALRQQGFTGDVSLVSDELGLPYQRPPLSKAYLLGKVCAADLAFRAQSFFSEHRVTLISSVAKSIDRRAQPHAPSEASHCRGRCLSDCGTAVSRDNLDENDSGTQSLKQRPVARL